MKNSALIETQPILIKGGLVLKNARARAEHLDILIKGGKINQLVSPGSISEVGCQVIDASHQLLMPGLINAHSHSHFSFGKGTNTDWTLELHQHATPGVNGGQTIEDLKLLAQLAAAEMISKGCTSCYDMVVQLPFPDVEGMRAIADGYTSVGLRARIAMTIADQTVWHGLSGLYEALPAEGKKLIDAISVAKAPEILRSCEAVLSSWSYSDERISLSLAPTIPLLCSEVLMRGAFDLSNQYKVGLHTHLAESKMQALSSIKKFGKSITQYLADIEYLVPQLTAAHAIWLDRQDMALLAEHEVKVAHNPGSNMRLGNGVAAVKEMINMGIVVGVGTDACTCSDQLNMFESMRQTALVSRVLSEKTESWLSAEDVFVMSTENGGLLMNHSHLGQIATDYAADIVFINLKNINYVPLNDALTQLVFNEEGGGVQSVMIAGEVVYKDKKFTKFDFDQLINEAHACNARRVQMLSGRKAEFQLYDKVVKSYLAESMRTSYPVNRYMVQS